MLSLPPNSLLASVTYPPTLLILETSLSFDGNDTVMCKLYTRSITFIFTYFHLFLFMSSYFIYIPLTNLLIRLSNLIGILSSFFRSNLTIILRFRHLRNVDILTDL